MEVTRDRYDITSADTKIVGTDFQFFYFVKELLSLKKGQKIGYEVKDDVHIDLPNNQSVLIQLKHTTLKDAKGETINLGELDDELIHTFENWVDVINDPFYKRNTIDKKKTFIEETKFVLATNKNIVNNKFVSQIGKIKSDEITIEELSLYVSELSEKTKSESVKKCLGKILNMDVKLLRLFIHNITVINQTDEIINDIRNLIEEKYIKKSNINNAFNDIFTEMKLRFFKNVNNGEKLVVSFEEWAPCASSIFQKYQSTLLPAKRFEKSLPVKLQEQVFIKELIDIGDINENDIVEMAEYTNYMLDMKMNIEEWYDNGEITNEEIELFHNIAKTYWKNSHKKCHRTNNVDNALVCLDEIRERSLEFESTSLNIQLSNGEFYYLSNEKMIGWIKKWEKKY